MQAQEMSDLAALGEDGVTIVCNRQCQDGHVCRYEIAGILPRWYLLGSLWDIVEPETRGLTRRRRGKWTGTERVVFFGEGWVKDRDRADHYRLSNYARDNAARGHRPKYRTTPLKRPFEQGGPLPVCTPVSYPAWALCPRCDAIRPGPSAWRRLERDVLRAITLVEAANH